MPSNGRSAKPLIEPQAQRKPRRQISMQVDEEVVDTWDDYCKYISSSREHVATQALMRVFVNDRGFQTWRANQKRDTGQGDTARTDGAAAGVVQE